MPTPRGSLSVWLAAALLAGSVDSYAAQHPHSKPVVLAPGYNALEFTAPAPGSYQLPPLDPAADGAVIDANGQPLHLHQLLGDKIVVLSFIYTSCNDVNGCPLATYVFKSIQDALVKTPGLARKVRLLSFSFDPEHDTPKVLREYSQHFKHDDFDWQFLTTVSQAQLEPILTQYGQSVIRDYDDAGNSLGNMSHLLRVFLIDKQMRIRNIYSMSFLHADTVANDIETLLAQNHP